MLEYAVKRAQRMGLMDSMIEGVDMAREFTAGRQAAGKAKTQLSPAALRQHQRGR